MTSEPLIAPDVWFQDCMKELDGGVWATLYAEGGIAESATFTTTRDGFLGGCLTEDVKAFQLGGTFHPPLPSFLRI